MSVAPCCSVGGHRLTSCLQLHMITGNAQQEIPQNQNAEIVSKIKAKVE